MVEESSLNRSNLSFEIIETEEPLDKIKIINEILDGKIDIILGNVANL